MIGVAGWLLTISGLALVGLGGYFVAARPALLPEDERFIGVSQAALLDAAPGLSLWLRRVFWVMGGYMSSTGVLVIYVANTALQSATDSALPILSLVWATAIGFMALVNLLIRSDFKWPILGLAGLWGLALVLAAMVQYA